MNVTFLFMPMLIPAFMFMFAFMPMLCEEADGGAEMEEPCEASAAGLSVALEADVGDSLEAEAGPRRGIAGKRKIVGS